MMDDPVAAIARAMATKLADEHGPRLITDVEAALHQREAYERYVDPIALASLIVSIASLAWTIYTDLRKENPNPTREAVARNVRLELGKTKSIDANTQQIIDLAVAETIQVNG